MWGRRINERVTENGNVGLGSHQGIIAHLIKILTRRKAVNSASTTIGYGKFRTRETTARLRYSVSGSAGGRRQGETQQLTVSLHYLSFWNRKTQSFPHFRVNKHSFHKTKFLEQTPELEMIYLHFIFMQIQDVNAAYFRPVLETQKFRHWRDIQWSWTNLHINLLSVWTSLNKQEWRNQYLSPNKCNVTHNKCDQNKYRPVLTLPTLINGIWICLRVLAFMMKSELGF